MLKPALLLNADYTPLRTIPFRKAMRLVVKGKVDLVEGYERMISSGVQDWLWPAVIRLKRYIAKARPTLRFSRENVLARDDYTCQYCGLQPVKKSGHVDVSQLTLEHVVPRASSVDGRVLLPWSGQSVPVTSWENVVIACRRCNGEKADRLPDSRGCIPARFGKDALRLRKLPAKPSYDRILLYQLKRRHIPDEWMSYLGTHGGENYWTVELSPD